MSVSLRAENLSAGYNGQPVVRGLDLRLEAGEVVALLGPNGAGKTTTILTLSGFMQPIDGRIVVDGRATTAPLHRRARRDLALVTEERSVFMGLTTAENLRIGRCDTDAALAIFPELRALLHRRAGLLSGGEHQMLALGRALARRPRFLLVDELALGLAPLVTERLLEAVRGAADSGVGVLLVEQRVRQALRVADRAYVMSRGQVALEGSSAEIRARLHEVEDNYLSMGALDD